MSSVALVRVTYDTDHTLNTVVRRQQGPLLMAYTPVGGDPHYRLHGVAIVLRRDVEYPAAQSKSCLL